jgi:hypothetical protein
MGQWFDSWKNVKADDYVAPEGSKHYINNWYLLNTNFLSIIGEDLDHNLKDHDDNVLNLIEIYCVDNRWYLVVEGSSEDYYEDSYHQEYDLKQIDESVAEKVLEWVKIYEVRRLESERDRLSAMINDIPLYKQNLLNDLSKINSKLGEI